MIDHLFRRVSALVLTAGTLGWILTGTLWGAAALLVPIGIFVLVGSTVYGLTRGGE